VRAVRPLILVALCLAALAWAGSAAALIVPQQSIAGVGFGMTRADVKAKKGEPDRIKHGSNDFGVYTQFIYKSASGKLTATFQGNAKLTAVDTNRPTQKTAEGIHVGSTEAALHAAYPTIHCEGTNFRHCWTGHFEIGHKVTDYRIGSASGLVKHITIARVID
jgi:hypothetical protein